VGKWRTDGLVNRPPLADDLFDERPLFAETIRSVHQVQPIAPLLRHRSDDETVEDVLQRLQAEGEGDPERFRQLTAVRYYLSYTVWRVSEEWFVETVMRNGSNYSTLVDYIRHHRKADEKILLVTLNYDRLLERALEMVAGVKLGSVNEYILNESYKVFKLHGSADWGHPIETPMLRDGRHFWDVLAEIIQRSPELKIGREFRTLPNHILSETPVLEFFPAIAIPLKRKSEFECPPEHIEALRAFLPQVNRMLIVGWKATEANFLRLLAETLPHGVHGRVVCATYDDARATIGQLQGAGIDTSDIHAYQQGFTSFVLGSEIRAFLQHDGN
jgi:hypothetical protein